MAFYIKSWDKDSRYLHSIWYHFKEKVKNLFNAVFGETVGIVPVDIFHYAKMDETPRFVTYFFHITEKLTVENMIFLCFYKNVLPRLTL